MQVIAVATMNVRGLPRRLWMSLAMILASAVVVVILLAFLAMAKGFEATMKGAGSDDLAIIIRKGASAEINSVITREQLSLLTESPGIARDTKGPDVSAELYVSVSGTKKDSGSETNIPLRGLGTRGMAMRKNMRLVAGHVFTPGTNEIMVGEGVLREFNGFEIGQEVRLGESVWIVVGIFSTGGNVFESEIWADAKMLQSLYSRGSGYQIVRARLGDSSELIPIEKTIEENSQLNNLDVKIESSFFIAQSKQLQYIAWFGRIVSYIMAVGALAGALNTMYTSVSDRAQEIATLRALGFNNFSAFFGTLVEAVMLAVVGGLFGSLIAYILFDGMNASTLGGSFTQVAFSFDMTLDLFIQGVTLALTIGIVSGFFPAWRAARMPVALAFRRNM
ncbi:ABC transporter permease [Microbulbifer sp. A4B17]|uniref:ABC transporter permease n=1 Tax=Microbulbifer sp. A4B17 TaxID=359370 RepID=UPI001EE15237|nr:ABC transporter permease [Microbulbifer sp. A4B17]